MINNIIPFVVFGYFFFHLRNNNFSNILTGLIFVSFFVFATNYNTLGLDFDIFRYLHRSIGVLVCLALLSYIFINKLNVFKDMIIKILTSFLLLILISYFNNEVNLNSYVYYVRNFIFVSIIAAYIYYMLDSNSEIEAIMNLIVNITLILSFFIILEIIQFGYSHRATLFYGNANYLAYALLPGLIFSIYTSSKYKWLSICLIIFSIFATGSRAAELSVIFSAVIYLTYKQYKLVYVVPGLLLFASIVTLFFNQIVTNKNYNNSRFVITKISINAFQENPFNGIGYAQFKNSFHKYVNDDILKFNNNQINEKFFANNPNSPLVKKYNNKESKSIKNNVEYVIEKEQMTHNDLISIIVEFGLLGIAWLVFVFYKLYIELVRLLLHNRNYYYLCITLIGSSLIFSLFHNNLTSFVFWFVIFFPFIINRNYKQIHKA